MILVTGAAGKTGLAVIDALGDVPVRALVHRDEQEDVVRSTGAADVVVGDLRDDGTLRRSMHGVDAVYLICPNMSADETAMGVAAVAAATTAGVGRFVYHSVLHPQIEAMPHHWRKLRVEERLRSSRLRWTVLQPAAYMDNVLAYRDIVTRQGRFAVPYATATRIAMVALADVAEVARQVLLHLGHDFATYELCGADALSQDEIAAVMGEAIGRRVHAEAVDRSAWRQDALASGMPAQVAADLVAMFAHYERHGFPGNATVLTELLGRRPTDFRAFTRRIAAATDR